MIESPDDFLDALGIDAGCMGSLRNYGGAALGGLLHKFGDDSVPEGFICGKTFKVQRNAIILFGRRFEYPFEMSEFEAMYANLRKSN